MLDTMRRASKIARASRASKGHTGSAASRHRAAPCLADRTALGRVHDTRNEPSTTD
jgi:hypothetical protein